MEECKERFASEQNGNEPLKIEDIRKDAERISMRRFLLDKIQQATL